MANVDKWFLPSKRRGRVLGKEGWDSSKFQNLPNDNGNWTGCQQGEGQLVGTYRSLSACFLSGVYGRPITEQELKSISVNDAKKLYKKHFWDKVKGDEIKSQLLAEFSADMRSSGGRRGVMVIQEGLNSLGANLDVDGSFGNLTLSAMNELLNLKGEEKVYGAVRSEAVTFYSDGQEDFSSGWLRRLDRDYPKYELLPEDRKNDGLSNNILKGSLGAALGAALVTLGVILITIEENK